MKPALLLFLLLLGLPAWAQEKVALQLAGPHQFRFAGYYAAVEKGYYRDLGLAVELREGWPGLDAVDEVMAGRAQFGVGNSSLVLARAAGKPVVALAVIKQHSSLILLARQGGIREVRDLAGKRLLMEPGATELFAYLKQQGLGEGSFQLLAHGPDPSVLIAGQVDAMSGYSTDEPFALRLAGFPYLVFSPRAAGMDFYGDNIFTSGQYQKEQRAQTSAFREASLKGWHYAMENPEELADLILTRYSGRHSREQLLFEAAEMSRLMQPELVEIGHMNPERWREIAGIYAAAGMVPRDLSIDGMVHDPRPPQIPAWVLTGGFFATITFVLVAAVAWRFAYFNRALNAEILARKEAEQVARANAENFRRLMDVAPVPVLVTGLHDERVLYMNEHARQALGVVERADDIVGKPLPHYYRNPEQRQKLLTELERHGLVTDLNVGVVNARGEPLDVLVSARVIDFEGKPAVYTVAIDITERTRAETAVRQSEAEAVSTNARLRVQLDEIAKLQAALEEQAIRDGLTGLFNRRYLDETLEREIARARRDNHPLCMVMLDIDHFKRLNDTYGHQAGDKAIRAVAEQLRHRVRAEDVPCRYGGEEFLILMPHMTLGPAAERAESWRRAIEEIRLDVPAGEEIRLTISVGVAAYPEHGRTPDELSRSADQALYRAKGQGRNQVVVYSPDVSGK